MIKFIVGKEYYASDFSGNDLKMTVISRTDDTVTLGYPFSYAEPYFDEEKTEWIPASKTLDIFISDEEDSCEAVVWDKFYDDEIAISAVDVVASKHK